MRRTWTIIGVADVAGSFKWYQSLLGLPETAPAHDHFGQILDTDGTVLLCLHEWGAHEHPSLTSPDLASPGNGLLLFLRVDDFDAALTRARTLVARLDEEPSLNPNTKTLEFSLRDPDGYYVTISALSAPSKPDDTAVRVALWRALHIEADEPPHVFGDMLGLRLAAPDDDWRDRPDMSAFTRPFRASIVARARFIEDLVAEQLHRGVSQYVILGAGLDTFAQRRPELASRMVVYEIDRPGPQAWKRHRLLELGLAVPTFQRFVPVDFEAGDEWWERLEAAGFDAERRAIVASTGVSMYLTRQAIEATLRHVATLAPGSTLAMSFMLPIEMSEPDVRPGIERAMEGARANGTPFISFFTPGEMLELARAAGFKKVEHVSAAALAERYFAERTDGLRPPNNSEELLVAGT
jgi:methyltransferase (TIGR00027 family)